MTPPVLAFFNNKGGVGKTMLAYHVAWMLNELGKSVVVLDLDPQANLTASFLDDERVERLWGSKRDAPSTAPWLRSSRAKAGSVSHMWRRSRRISGWCRAISCCPGQNRNSASPGPAAWIANSAPSG